MASVVESIVQPDENAIKAHLEILFAPVREVAPSGLIEIAYGQAAPNKAQYFNVHPDGVADATAFAAARSRAGENVYVGVNPRQPNIDRTKRASDDACPAAFWHFADIDKAESLEGLGRKLRALPPTFSVDTGTTPHRRPHLYWLLDDHVRNMAAWTQRQAGIAATLGGDSVINPSRIMRLAGSVNFPAPHKVQRGYRVEVVTIRTEFEDEREPVTPDEIAAAFPTPQGATETVTHPVVSGGSNTLSAMRPTRIHDLIAACQSGEEWHNNMIRLVAHLAAIGRTSTEIVGLAYEITLPGYTVDQTRREMIKALEGARTKWALPEPDDTPIEAEEAQREEADSIFELLDFDELEELPPPSWLIDDFVVDDGLTVVYGDPGAGKSFVALDMALRIANGMDWHGVPAKSVGVLYIAGEGARGLGKRVKGWRREHGLEGVDAPFLLLPVAVELLDPAQRAKLLRTIDAAARRAGFTIGLIVVDTVSRALAGSDENGQEAMGAFVAACDAIKRHAGGALLGVHHSGKDKDRGMRGSTVLLGACDAVVRVTKNEQLVTLKTEKQKDAEEAAPINFDMRKVVWATGLEKEQSTLVPFLSEVAAQGEIVKINGDMIRRAFGKMADAWGAGNPLSHKTQTRRDGRYAPSIFASQIGGEADEWVSYIQSWLENECLVFDAVSSHSKKSGLKVLQVPDCLEASCGGCAEVVRRLRRLACK